MPKKRVSELHEKAIESVGDSDDIEISTRIRKSDRVLKDRPPEEYWMQGFQEGYKKAWDTMMPTMLEGVEKAREKIEERAIEKTLDGLETVIKRRIDETGSSEMKGMNEILEKRESFKKKRDESFESDQKLKYEHFISVMDWMISTHGDKL